MQQYRLGFVIPVYNHPHYIKALLDYSPLWFASGFGQ